MRATTIATALAAAAILFSLAPMTAITASAEDFSAGSHAEELGLVGETKATFSGKVVDLLCEIAGDCAPNCGDGRRQLGILRESDNHLVVVSKNAQFEFNGAVDDLLPYCNRVVDVDGLLLGDDSGVKAKIFMAQFIRLKGETEWKKAERWTKAWEARNPAAAGEAPWYRRDPRVLKQIEKKGYFGLGKDVDKAWQDANQ